MLARPFESRRHRRLGAIVHGWVLLAFLMGVVGSSIGHVKSHGLAALGTVQHGTACCSDDGHGHAHDEEGFISEGAGHPHHSEDHSHDRVHVLPPQLALASPEPSWWRAATGRCTAPLTFYRLERPPMA